MDVKSRILGLDGKTNKCLKGLIHTVSESHAGDGGKSNHGLELHSERKDTSESGNPRRKKKNQVIDTERGQFILMCGR